MSINVCIRILSCNVNFVCGRDKTKKGECEGECNLFKYHCSKHISRLVVICSKSMKNLSNFHNFSINLTFQEAHRIPIFP